MYFRYSFATRSRARFAVADYVEVSRKRMHPTIGYRTPAQALADYHRAPQAA